MNRKGRQHGKTAINSESYTGPAESETLSMRGHSMLENREISAVPVGANRRRVGQGRPVAAILACTPLRSQTPA